MVNENSNPQIHFFKVPGHDHFSVIAPLAETLADQIVKGQVNVTEQDLRRLREFATYHAAYASHGGCGSYGPSLVAQLVK